MAGYKLLKRLEILIEILQHRPGISKAEIIDKLHNDFDITTSERTLERDFKALADEFRIDVAYARDHNGYVLDNENQKRIQSLLKFIELVHIGEIFKEGLNDFELLKNNIDIEDSARFKGIAYIREILLAIKKKRQLHFTHENYWEETKKEFTIIPLRLKEYLNRWYVVGQPEGEEEIRTFGIDRISGLKTGKVAKFKRKDFVAQLDQFINVVGLNYSSHNKVEEIKLRVNTKQIKYLASLPLHHSQKINGDLKEKYGMVSYRLIPNYEFKIEILKMNSMIEVLEPEWFREEIIQMVKDTLKTYGM